MARAARAARAARKAKGLTLKQVAKMVRRSTEFVRQAELVGGRATYDTICRLAPIYGCPWHAFMDQGGGPQLSEP